jgi:ribonuclease R
MIITGRYSNDSGPHVTPLLKGQNFTIRVPYSKLLKNGDIVRVIYSSEIKKKKHGRYLEQFTGKVTERLMLNEDGVDKLMVSERFGHEKEFKAKIKKELEDIISMEDDMKDRKEVSGEFIVTIDSESAKDLDDAVSLRKEGNKWRLVIYIADVSFFVRKDTALDQEAFKRATSVYYGNEVIPMLPPLLSDGYCSLNPGEDKFVMAAEMLIDDKGNVTGYSIYPAKIRVSQRLSYNQVNKILKLPALDELSRNLHLMKKLMVILKDKRLREGSIDFDLDETKIRVDEQGKTVAMERVAREYAEKMIEEFMLMANQTVAKFLSRNDLPVIFRIHDEPDNMKVENFNAAVSSMNMGQIDLRNIKPEMFQKFIDRVKNKENEKLVIYLILRTMQQAMYSAENRGHFGLAFTHYTHFTSPIRRYPDLMTHRSIKYVLSRKRDQKYHYSYAEMEKIASQSTIKEKLATEAERYYQKLKQVRFLKNMVGKIFDGVVTGINNMGVYVELVKYPVEGLLLRSWLMDDYYILNESGAFYKGRKTGNVIKLGKTVRIKVRRVDDIKYQIDFESVVL